MQPLILHVFRLYKTKLFTKYFQVPLSKTSEGARKLSKLHKEWIVQKQKGKNINMQNFLPKPQFKFDN
jgi:hypothetical protein